MKKRIKVRRRGSNRFGWSEHLAALLGKMPDTKLAKKAGVSTSTVQAERRRRGIPPFRGRAARVEWTPEMIALLGKSSDAQVAASQSRWTPEEDALLGTESDPQIARRLGRSSKSVVQRRTRLKIPSNQAQVTPTWTPEEDRLLGTDPDSVIAECLGRSALAVEKRRRKLGIVAFRLRTGTV